MKSLLMAAAALLLFAFASADLARAQRLPDGSYLNTCKNVRLGPDGRDLYADCLDTKGRYQKAATRNPYDCDGYLDNINGKLLCNVRAQRAATR